MWEEWRNMLILVLKRFQMIFQRNRFSAAGSATGCAPVLSSPSLSICLPFQRSPVRLPFVLTSLVSDRVLFYNRSELISITFLFSGARTRKLTFQILKPESPPSPPLSSIYVKEWIQGEEKADAWLRFDCGFCLAVFCQNLGRLRSEINTQNMQEN